VVHWTIQDSGTSGEASILSGVTLVMTAEVLSRPTLVITIEQHLTFKNFPIKMLEGDNRVIRHTFKVVKIL
jgi:hypothetical protein